MNFHKKYLKPVISSILMSYSQVFFSQNILFALLLIIVTFFDPITGASGLITVIVSNFFAWLLGFDRNYISNGDYGFNALLVGLGLGILYTPSPPFFLLLFIAGLATFIFTVMIAGFLEKYNLPYLSVPFLIGIWTFILASRGFDSLVISARGVYRLNELYATGSNALVSSYQYLNQIPFPVVLKIYFKSLGAILFQFNMLSGIIIAIGLLVYSRIAFSLSVLSFVLAYFFFRFMGANIDMLNYSYIGFNFILSGIALGSFYIIPSKESYFWTFLLIPVLLILTASLASIFQPLQLSIYSLPFNIVVISFLYVLKLRFYPGRLKEVPVQHFKPESNLYHHITGSRRFRHYRDVPVSLPVYGEWYVSQGYNGTVTHRGEWKEAIDLVMIDEENKTYDNPGLVPEDYYCYNKPVIAPADGEVEEIHDFVEDNPIGESNLIHNWGNSIVIRHNKKVYSQISHLKPGSFKVKKGDTVKKGDPLALCGNSGRSPEPHVHFQMQSTPYIGSRTLDYPISHFISRTNQNPDYHFSDYPLEKSVVYNINTDENLSRAFHFLPGQILKFEITEGGKEVIREERWEVNADVYNNTFIRCLTKNAKAFFIMDDTSFYFTHFEGNRQTGLYHFFLAAYKVVFHSERNLIIYDEIPLHLYSRSFGRFLNDFIAPFFNLFRVDYRNELMRKKENGEEIIEIESEIRSTRPGRRKRILKFRTEIKKQQIFSIELESGNKRWLIRCAE